ncbi:hypothetical protein [Fulvimarina sp. MAC3]|uniref:hypothetical protein n=1 Tax=Fulvimarina sp. MAC3 TaxID=3148887 RepID=UPI0031FC5DBF
MAKLPYSFRAHVFEQGLDDLLSAYSAAAGALENRPKEIEEDLRRHLRLAPGEPFPEPDETDEGRLLDDIYDQASDTRAQALNSAHMLRKAFLIALFHHWERFCNSETRKPIYFHPRGWLGQRGKRDYAKDIQKLARVAN